MPYDITYMWNLKYDTNEHMYETKQTHRYREQTSCCQAEGGLREGWMGGFEISRCNLLYMGWINKFLLYSTGNNIQYPVTNNNGEEFEIYACITESL